MALAEDGVMNPPGPTRTPASVNVASKFCEQSIIGSRRAASTIAISRSTASALFLIDSAAASLSSPFAKGLISSKNVLITVAAASFKLPQPAKASAVRANKVEAVTVGIGTRRKSRRCDLLVLPLQMVPIRLLPIRQQLL